MASLARRLLQAAALVGLASGQNLLDSVTAGWKTNDPSTGYVNVATGDGVLAGNTNSYTTLSLDSSPLAKISNLQNLYETVFGVRPQFNDVKSSSDFWTQMVTIISSSTLKVRTDCSWQVTLSADQFNISFPDQYAYYHIQYIPNFSDDDVLMIKGTFPDARYFSYQSYDGDYAPVNVLRDLDIVPDTTGANPFANVITDPALKAKNTYTIYVTKTGDKGFPNEMAVVSNRDDTGDAFVFLRVYGADPNADLTQASLKSYGYVAPPTVYRRTSGTITPTSKDLMWSGLSLCPDANTQAVKQASTAIIQLGYGNNATKACSNENIPNNYFIYARNEGTKTARAPFTNQDAKYLVGCANNRKSYLNGNDLVVFASANLPTTPAGKFVPPYTSDVTSYQVRYLSFSVYDLNIPSPVLKTVNDAMFTKFYSNLYGADVWQNQYFRNVSLIVAKNSDVLKRCNVDASQSFFVPLNQQNPVSDWFGVVYREVVPQTVAIDPEKAYEYGVNPNDLYMQSVYEAKQEATDRTGGLDQNPYRLAENMGPYAPSVKYYLCSPEGVLSEAPHKPDPYNSAGYTRTSFDLRAPSWWEAFCPIDQDNHGLVKVYAPTSVHIHNAGIGPKAVEMNTGGLAAFPIPSTQKEIVIGISPKADLVEDSYFVAEIQMCGLNYVSDFRWKCINHYPPDDSWLQPDYDDSAWTNAVMVGDNTARYGGLSQDAIFIQALNPTRDTHCRLVIPNHTYQKYSPTATS